MSFGFKGTGDVLVGFDLGLIMRGDVSVAAKRCQDALQVQGLVLSAQEARELFALRDEHLVQTQRVERGVGILPELVSEFAGSPCLLQPQLAQQLSYLQQAFYHVRDDAPNYMADNEILAALRRAFEGAAGGDAEELAQMDVREILMMADHCGPDDRREDEASCGWASGGAVYRISDDAGRVYVFDPEEWHDDVLSPGWLGESWNDAEGDQ